MSDTTPQPLAIVGIGALFPKADSLQAYWANVKGAVDCITEVPSTHWDPKDLYDPDPKAPDKVYAKTGGFLETVDFDPLEFGISPQTLEATDTSQLLALVAAKRALEDAGYGEGAGVDRDRISCILGVTGTLELVIPLGARLGHPLWRRALDEAGVDPETADDVVQRIADGYVPWQENSFPGLLGNVVAGRIANRLDLGGTNCVVDAACASSLSAVHLAALELQAGRADMVVTGGVDTFNDIFMYSCFSKTPALSPTGHARPFDASGDGTILGEGIGVLVLKRLADAEAQGDRIYAVLRGIGSSSDGKGTAIYAPAAKGQVKALKRAYADAGFSPATVEMVEAHGTGTKVGDATEVKALSEVYREAQGEGSWCALGSVKSQIGHTKAAAGSASLIKAALALHAKVLPPTIKVDTPNEAVAPGTSPFYVNTEKRPWVSRTGHPRRAALSALGFGGSNFHCVLEEHDPVKTEPDWDGKVQLVALSGADAKALTADLDRVPTGDWKALRLHAAATRESFDTNAAARLLLVIEQDRTDVAKQVANARARLAGDATGPWMTPDGAVFATGEAPGQVALLFPGQGAQTPGMLRDLACLFPEMLDALEQANAGSGVDGLSDLIYPHPAFDDETRARQRAALTATDIAQPALGAVEAGALGVMRRFGIEAHAAAGHSYGELVALHAAGCYDAESLARLSRKRGELMAGDGGDRGTMLAVRAPIAEVQATISEAGLDLVVANHNAPEQCVLSGARSEIDRAEVKLKELGLAAKRLDVAAAFHSTLVADAAEPFAEALADIDWSAPSFPVFANTTAAEYPAESSKSKDLLSHQLAKPVEFVREIEALHAAGCRTFLEIGPGGRLSGLVRAILGDAENHAIALDASNGKRDGVADLAMALARLAALGHAVTLTAWDAGWADVENARPKRKAAMSVPLTGANYVNERPARPPRERKPAPVTPQAAAPQTTAPAATSGAPTDPALVELLRVSQQQVAALQQLAQQTADVHRRFLESQDAAQAGFASVLEHQQRTLGLVAGVPQAPRAVAPTTPAAPLPPTLAAPTPPAPVVAPPAAAAVPAASLAAPPAIAAAALDGLQPALLEVVAEKTGYPTDILELDMDLEADLGIDSIKRVEILSAVQERFPDLPAVEPEALGTLDTLRQVLDHLAAATPAAAQSAPAAPAAAATAPGFDIGALQAALLGVVAEKTGYPEDILELDMDLEADLGIDSIKRVEILSALQERFPETPAVEPEALGTLDTLRQVLEHVSAAAPATAVAAAPSGGLDLGGLQAALLAVVAEKTGYPQDILELDMDLEADLGIDSIKRVEILSALQERFPDTPAVEPEALGTLDTLRQVLEHVGAAAPVAATATPAATGSLDSSALQEALLAVVAEKTGYPQDILELDMDLEADLGIDSIKRVEILSALQERFPEAPAVEPEALGALDTLRQVLDHLDADQPAPEAATPPPAPEAETEDETPSATAGVERSVPEAVPMHGPRETIALPDNAKAWVAGTGDALSEAVVARLRQRGLDASLVDLSDRGELELPRVLRALVVVAPETGADEEFLKKAFFFVQDCAPALRLVSPSVLATVSRLDGRFGLGELDAKTDPRSGGLAGLAKTAELEWDEVRCKALDVAPTLSTEEASQVVADEVLLSGPIEVGADAEGRWVLRLSSTQPRTDGRDPLETGDLVVVSGGARGVTADCVVALAEAFQPSLLLLGRSAAPTEEEAWLAELEGEAVIKKALLEHEGPRSPRELGSRYGELAANREVLRTLERIRAAGSEVDYAQADVRDAEALETTLRAAVAIRGPVRGLVHGAGVLADQLIEDKTEEAWDRVIGTKVSGLTALLSAIDAISASGPSAGGPDELKILALFSSSTARFGRKAQVDYAVANEVLNKTAQQQQRLRPGCRVASIGWGPWDGGMVTPALRKLFQAEGVEVIAVPVGAKHFVDELRLEAGASVESVVLGGEIVPQPELAGRHEESEGAPLETAFRRKLKLEDHPILASHVIKGRAVLPAALMIEWLAHAALHANPGLCLHGFDSLRVLKGIVVDPDSAPTLRALAGPPRRQGDLLAVPVELHGTGASGREFLHARAEILLSSALPAPPAPAAAPAVEPYADADAVYEKVLFHGPDLQGLVSIEGLSDEGIIATLRSAPAPKDWLSKPLRGTWLADPLAIDSVFQALIVWTTARKGAASLPVYVGAYRQYRRSFPRDGLRLVARVTKSSAGRALSDIDLLDADGVLVARLEDYECVIDASLAAAFRQNRLTGRASQ